MPGRLERALTLCILLVTACTVLPATRPPAHAETRHVALPGAEADTLAETTGGADEGLVPVHTHDGRDLWVREDTLGGAAIIPGTYVLVRQNGQLVTAPVTRSLDDFVEITSAGSASIVPAGDVVARLHHGPPAPPAISPPPPPPVVTPPPPTPLGRMAALESTRSMRAAQLVSCSGGNGHVLFADGTDAMVAMSTLHPLRVQTGMHVMANWDGSPYPATILGVEGTLVHSHWDDGDDRWIELTEVVAVDGEVTGAVHGCPHRRVLVDEGARTRVGRVLACAGGMATVLDTAGSPSQLSLETLSRAPIRVGDRVEARWNGTPYDATVLTLGERIHIRWYDGSEGDVDPADVVSFLARDERPSEPVLCPDV